jgi:hypothetical protein
MPVNEREGILFPLANAADDRKNVASMMKRVLGQKVPVLLDAMEDATSHAYAALPNRYYLIAEAGRVRFRARPGPGGADPDGLEAAIIELLGERMDT